MDSDQLRIFQARIRDIVSRTNDLEGLDSIRSSLYNVDRTLREQYAGTEQERRDLLENQVLQHQVRRKLRLLIIKGQETGLVKTAGNRDAPYSSKQFSENSNEYAVMGALGKLSDEEFEAFIRKGRERGDLSLGESKRLLGLSDAVIRREEQIYEMALLPGATRTEISIKTGISKTHVQYILKKRGVHIPLGTAERQINRSLNAAKVIDESLHMIDDILPALMSVDIDQLTAEEARNFSKPLAFHIGKLRILARSLKRIEDMNGNTSTEANPSEEG